jgi:3-dehydroquinate synthetase
VEQMIAAMQVDKKTRDGKINLVLLYGIGKAALTDQYDVNLFQQTLKEGYATVP